MRFAGSTEFVAEPSGLQAAVERLRRAGAPFLDLTVTNPTRCGFAYEQERLLGAMGDPASLRYEADALGMQGVRRIVAEQYYASRGGRLSPESILLTASTSEAYGYVLRLLCDPGDQVLVPQPSYPLFDLLARMHDVELVPYPLVYHDGWQVEPEALARAVTARCRAVVVVHPNHPTGHFTGAAERKMLERFAERHDLAIVADEVFLDYPVSAREPPVSFAAGERPPVLTVVLSGISKVLALPQMKLAWMAVRGPESVERAAMARLEIIADTFLSVSAPVQLALAGWLGTASRMQTQIAERMRANLAAMTEVFAAHPLSASLPVEGGWSAVLRLPALELDTQFALRLMETEGVIVHPGSFYGLGERGWFVVSLLTPSLVMREGVNRIATLVDEMATGESFR